MLVILAAIGGWTLAIAVIVLVVKVLVGDERPPSVTLTLEECRRLHSTIARQERELDSLAAMLVTKEEALRQIVDAIDSGHQVPRELVDLARELSAETH